MNIIQALQQMPLLPVLANVLIGFMFFAIGMMNIVQHEKMLKPMLQFHFPYPRLFFWLSVLAETLSGLLIMINYFAIFAAIYLILFTWMGTIVFFPIWKAEQNQRLDYLTSWCNALALTGGLLYVVHFSTLS